MLLYARAQYISILLSLWLAMGFGRILTNAQTPSDEPRLTPATAVQKILDQASQFTKDRQPQKALEAANGALSAAQQIKDSIGEAQAHRSQGLALQELRRTEAAIAAWREAAAAWERVGDGPGQVEALAAAGFLLWGSQPAEADALFAQALQIGRAESKRPLAVATALHEIGVFCDQRRMLGPARRLFEASLMIRERLAPSSLAVAASLHNLGLVVGQQGYPSAAKDYHQRALNIRERLAPNSLEVARSLISLGLVAHSQKDLTAAKDYYQQALNIQEQQAPDSLAVAVSLNNLGIVAGQQGDLAAAADYHRRALAIREKQAPGSLAVAASLSELGIVARQQGDLAAAADYHRRALAIREKRGLSVLDVAASLNNLGIVARQQGDLAGAADYHRRALTLQEKLAPNSEVVAASLNNMGAVAEQQGDLTAAADYHRRALAIDEKHAPHSLEVAMSLHGLGITAEKQGDLVAAAGYFQRALAIQEKLAPNSLNVAMSLDKLGIVAFRQGNLKEAERLTRRAWDVVRWQAAAVTGDEARQAFDVSTASYATHLVRYQLALGKSGEAFLTLEESRAQALQQRIFERYGIASVIGSQRWPAYQAALARRNRAEHALSQAIVAQARIQQEREAQGARAQSQTKITAALEAAAQRSEAAQSAYAQARVKVDELWAEIKKNAPRAFAPPLKLEQAQKALPPGTLLVAFSVGAEQSYLFLLRSGDDPASALSVHPIALTYGELQTRVGALRAEVTHPERVDKTVAASRALFAKLFSAEARTAVATASRLLISPDGPLWEAPFAALVTNSEKESVPSYLGIVKPITYTPSLTLYVQSRADAPQLAQGHPPSAVVVGDPIFDRKARLTASTATANHPTRGERSYLYVDDKPPLPLPATRTEAIRIAQLYGAVPLLGEAATEAALRSRIETADVIHLATHGYLHPVRAMSSGVLLTAPEQEPAVGETDNDGVLQAWEIYSQLQLKAELVVLSACETGRGQNVRGEGMIGMTRALQYAGARSIIASQWKADDQRTLTLMVMLHRQLRQGLAKDEALRRAMAHLRANPSTAHPYYWAPFFLIGDPENPNLGVTWGP